MKRSLAFLMTLVLVVTLLFALGTSALAASVNATVGEYISESLLSLPEGQYVDNYSASGSLPSGLELGLNNSHSQILLYGTPTEASSVSFTLNYTAAFEDSGKEADSGSFSVSVAVTAPVPTPDPSKAPKITKNPTSETRPEGGDTLFIAKAENYTSCYWEIVAPDGTEMSVSGFKAKFPNVYISGDKTTTLAISNFEKAMSGYKFICVFDNNVGRAATTPATITVTERPATTSTPKPTATAAPSASPKPTATPEPGHEHKFGTEWVSDNSKHWHECECGMKADEADHVVTDWAKREDGSLMGVCSVCAGVVYKEAEVTPVPAPVPAPVQKSGPSALAIVLIVVLCLIALIVLIGLFLMIRARSRAAAGDDVLPEDSSYNPRHDGIHDDEDRAAYYREQLKNYEDKQ